MLDWTLSLLSTSPVLQLVFGVPNLATSARHGCQLFGITATVRHGRHCHIGSSSQLVSQCSCHCASQGDSHEIALSKGRHEISAMIDQFMIRPREDTLEAAHRLYKLAVQRGFTKGRRVAQVAAACLYIICRQENKPFMLIDYSDLLQVGSSTLQPPSAYSNTLQPPSAYESSSKRASRRSTMCATMCAGSALQYHAKCSVYCCSFWANASIKYHMVQGCQCTDVSALLAYSEACAGRCNGLTLACVVLSFRSMFMYWAVFIFSS